MIQFQHLKQLELSRVSIIMVSGIMITLVIAINLTVSEAFLSLPSFNKDVLVPILCLRLCKVSKIKE